MQQELTDYDILIANYLDNNITPKEKLKLTEWVNATKENKTYFEQLAKAWEKSTIELQDQTDARKRATNFIEQIGAKRRRKLYLLFTGAAAAVALLFIGLQFWGTVSLFNNNMQFVTAYDTKKEVVLPDGSVVWLNAQSTLKYPAKFKRSRSVTITGEAYFDVKKENEKPFSVRTPNITIEVLGTTFLVTDREESPRAEAVLASGKVNLTVNATGEELEMKPNQQIIYNKKEKSTEQNIVNASNYTGWRKESLAFENTPLKDVFTQLSKWYNIDIICHVNNAKLLNTPVSFTLDDEPVEDILVVLQYITSFTWSKSNPNIIIIE